jgi:AcrR family transcriptional regulator
MAKLDRRIQRTQKLLQIAFMELMDDHEYDAITVQDIVNHANVGRTTFYEHYNSKDDLFLSCHESFVKGLHEMHSYSKSLFLTDTPSEMISAYQNLLKAQVMLKPIFQNHNKILLQHIRDGSARGLESALHTNFDEDKSSIPFNILANYLARAQIALFQWWLEKRQPNTVDELVQTFYRLQGAAIREAFGLGDNE